MTIDWKPSSTEDLCKKALGRPTLGTRFDIELFDEARIAEARAFYEPLIAHHGRMLEAYVEEFRRRTAHVLQVLKRNKVEQETLDLVQTLADKHPILSEAVLVAISDENLLLKFERVWRDKFLEVKDERKAKLAAIHECLRLLYEGHELEGAPDVERDQTS